MQRTLPAREDLDWLPPSFKALRWAIAGGTWTATLAAVASVILVARHGFFFIWWKPMAALFAGGWYAGDRASRAMVRRRMSRLAHGSVDLSKLRNEADGELVHVTGRIRAGETMRGLLSKQPCVLQRVVFTLERDRWVHEAGCDFWLVDGQGQSVRVEVEGARLIVPDPRLLPEDPTQFIELTGAPAGTGVTAGEVLLRDGEEVEIVGYKTQSIDPHMATLPREAPLNATLRSGRALPLLISPRS